MTPRKWYFCVNALGFDRTFPLVAAAVASARANTALRPVCLYDGDDPRHPRRLERLGVEVVRHRSSLEPELRRGYGDKFDQFSGHWLRIDLPLIEAEEAVVLYTDVDVMFLGPPEVEAAPPLLAAAPEFEIEDRSYFNSGVMVMNLPGLRRVHGAFTDAIRERLLGDFRYPAHDQESFNRFFDRRPLNRLRGRAFTPLSPLLNWKPYWGVNPDARIVHWHGPKPRLARTLDETGGAVETGDTYRRLWARAPEAYRAYLDRWEAFRDQGSPRRRARRSA